MEIEKSSLIWANFHKVKSDGRTKRDIFKTILRSPTLVSFSGISLGYFIVLFQTNSATGETSWVITPFHYFHYLCFFDYSCIFDFFTSLTILTSSSTVTTLSNAMRLIGYLINLHVHFHFQHHLYCQSHTSKALNRYLRSSGSHQ